MARRILCDLVYLPGEESAPGAKPEGNIQSLTVALAPAGILAAELAGASALRFRRLSLAMLGVASC